MENPQNALRRFTQIFPDIPLDLVATPIETLCINKVDMELWATIFERCLKISQRLEIHLNGLPNLPSVERIQYLFEDLHALVHSLYIFYKCTQYDKNKNRDRD